MRLNRRRPAALAVLAAALMVCAAFARPDVVRGLNLDFWSITRLRGEIDQAEQFGQELDAQRPALHCRQAMRHRVVTDLIHRRTTVATAAEVYRLLNKSLPPLQVRANQSDEEIACRQLLMYAKWNLKKWSPLARAVILARLRSEIRVHLAAMSAGVAEIEMEAD